MPEQGCVPLNVAISLGTGLFGWNVGSDGTNERLVVTKSTTQGGVLCCID
jgi:hypothetical protein